MLLNRLLPLFFLPFGVSLMLLVWGLTRRRLKIAAAGLIVLLVSSNPLVAHYLIRSVEGWADRRLPTEVAAADAVVVLSAGRIVAPGVAAVDEWNDPDRFFGGVQLMQAGKAPLLVFTGASHSSLPVARLEGDILADYAVAFGIGRERIAVTGRVLNTADEASAVARLLRERGLENPRIVLVTSAFHMSRAALQFEQVGLTVERFPVDFFFSQGWRVSILHALPSPGAIGQVQLALREYYGKAFYWLRQRF